VSARARTQALEAPIEAHAVELKLPTVKRRFRALAQEATREQQTPVAYLAALPEAEHQERAERREKRRLIDARFPLIKRLEEFRFADNPNIPQATIAALAEGSWIDDRESIILARRERHRETHLATAIAVCACQQGRRVRFTTLAGLANELQEAESRRELGSVVGRYASTELVVLDELGYLALPEGAAEPIFQVLSERHERGSLIVTTNLPFGEWTRVFSDARLAKAVVDRHTHKAHIIETGTESWRFRHGLERRPQRDEMTPCRSARPAARSARSYGPRSARRRTPYVIITTNHQPQRVGPLQATTPGPLQAAAPSRGERPLA
jgi:DNA replication protein DnaC